MNLRTRTHKNHLQTNSTGQSTLRRSLGAILKTQLHLRAVHRGNGTSASDYSNYRFDNNSEQELTNWMLNNLEISFQVETNPDLAEKELIIDAEPILNLNSWKNPDSIKIREMRKLCSNEARANSNIFT